MVKKSKKQQNPVSKAVVQSVGAGQSGFLHTVFMLQWHNRCVCVCVRACELQPRCHSTGGTLWTSRVSWQRRRSWSGTPSMTTARRSSCPASSWPTDMNVRKVHNNNLSSPFYDFTWYLYGQISSANFFEKLAKKYLLALYIYLFSSSFVIYPFTTCTVLQISTVRLFLRWESWASLVQPLKVNRMKTTTMFNAKLLFFVRKCNRFPFMFCFIHDFEILCHYFKMVHVSLSAFD